MIRRKIFVYGSLVLILLVSLIVLWFHPVEQKGAPQQTISGDQQAAELEGKQKTQFTKLMEAAKKAPDKVKELMMANPKMAAMDAMGKAMNSSFQFYGKVVDQHGEAVPNVKVVYSMGGFGSFGQPFSRVNSVQSDSNGVFTLSGDSSSFSFRSLSKIGYEFTHVESYYTFPQHKGMKLKYKGTPDKPVLIQTWKKGEVAELIFEKDYYNFTSDGAPYTVDLHKRTKTKGVHQGDLIVTYDAETDTRRHSPLDWKFVVKSIDGGLIQTDDPYMNEAPEAGYQPTWMIESKKDDENYIYDSHVINFYLKSRGGKSYARIKLEFLPYYPNGVGKIHIRSWLNPTGSRNLQSSRKF